MATPRPPGLVCLSLGPDDHTYAVQVSRQRTRDAAAGAGKSQPPLAVLPPCLGLPYCLTEARLASTSRAPDSRYRSRGGGSGAFESYVTEHRVLV